MKNLKGIKHFADRPSAYLNLPAQLKEFLKKVPVNWENTKLVEGYPGEKVIIARKHREEWYVGGINGKDSTQTLNLTFDFLDKDTFSLELIKDGADSNSFETEIIKIKKGTL